MLDWVRRKTKNFVKNGDFEYWIGLTDKEKEGTWKWNSGRELSGNKDWWGWRKMSGCGSNCEPNNAKNQQDVDEDCAAICHRGYGVCDIPCKTKKPFLCQRAPIKQLQKIWEISHSKYTDKYTNIYYSNVRKTYSEAREECDNIGATMIDDEETLKRVVRFAHFSCHKPLKSLTTF